MKFLMLLKMASFRFEQCNRILKLMQGLNKLWIQFPSKCVSVIAFEVGKKRVLIEEEKERSIDSIHIPIHE